MPTVNIRRGEIIWTQDLNGSTATTAYPTGTSEGEVARAPGRLGDRCHVKLRYQVASGTLSTDCHLYALDYSTTHWSYIGSLNGGSSIASSTKWNLNASTIAIQEVFTIAPENVKRIASRIIAPGGTTPLVSTWIGFEVG